MPVPDGHVRVLHHRPQRIQAKRPVVILPGFSATVPPWQGCYAKLQGHTEFYVIETLEKSTTRIEGRSHDLSFLAFARQADTAVQALGLPGQDYVLMASSLLATSLFAGLPHGLLDAPTKVALDPLRRMWFPRFFLKWFLPAVPEWFVDWARGPVAQLALRGMAPAQKARAEAFLEAADPYRWKRAAMHNAVFDLFDVTPVITQQVTLLLGVGDKVHDDTVARRAASELPDARLLVVPSEPLVRERMAGAVISAMARISAADPLPSELVEFLVLGDPASVG